MARLRRAASQGPLRFPRSPDTPFRWEIRRFAPHSTRGVSREAALPCRPGTPSRWWALRFANSLVSVGSSLRELAVSSLRELGFGGIIASRTCGFGGLIASRTRCFFASRTWLRWAHRFANLRLRWAHRFANLRLRWAHRFANSRLCLDFRFGESTLRPLLAKLSNCAQ